MIRPIFSQILTVRAIYGVFYEVFFNCSLVLWSVLCMGRFIATITFSCAGNNIFNSMQIKFIFILLDKYKMIYSITRGAGKSLGLAGSMFHYINKCCTYGEIQKIYQYVISTQYDLQFPSIYTVFVDTVIHLPYTKPFIKWYSNMAFKQYI